MSQDQHRVIIYINFVELASRCSMLSFKIIGGEDFLKVFTIYGSCDLSYLYKIAFLFSKRLHIKFGFDWQSGLGDEDLANNGHIHGIQGFFHIWMWRPSWSCDLDQ